MKNYKVFTLFSSLVQIAMLLSLTCGQWFKMQESLNGVSLSLFVFAILYISMNLWLSLDALKNCNDFQSRWQVRVYWAHIFAYVVIVVVILYLSYSRHISPWDDYDNFTSALALGTALVSFMYVVFKKIDIESNPILRLLFALSFRVLPQCIMAYKILQLGGFGISVYYIVSFHILKGLRIYGVWLAYRDTKDKYHKAVMLSEIGNELSWCLVTWAWI